MPNLLPDGFDDRMLDLAVIADRLARHDYDRETQSRAAAEMSYQLRRMAAFNRRSER